MRSAYRTEAGGLRVGGLRVGADDDRRRSQAARMSGVNVGGPRPTPNRTATGAAVPRDVAALLSVPSETPGRVVIRGWRAGDADRIQSASPRISPNSLYLRFLVGTARLPEPYLRMLRAHDPSPITDDWLAYLAVVDDAVIGWSERRSMPSGEIEGAILVVDEWQRRGVGRRLARLALARCRADGIGTIQAVVHPENHAVRALLRSERLRRSGTGTWQVASHFADGLQHVTLTFAARRPEVAGDLPGGGCAGRGSAVAPNPGVGIPTDRSGLPREPDRLY